MRAAPDGYTWMILTSQLLIASAVYPNVKFDLQRDFASVALIGTVPFLLMVNPQLPAKSVARTDRSGEEIARRAALWLGGNRRRRASHRGDVHAHGRDQHAARALQRHSAGRRGHDLARAACGLRRVSGRVSRKYSPDDCEGSASLRRHARRCCPTCRRSPQRSRLRHVWLVQRRCADGHAAAILDKVSAEVVKAVKRARVHRTAQGARHRSEPRGRARSSIRSGAIRPSASSTWSKRQAQNSNSIEHRMQ